MDREHRQQLDPLLIAYLRYLEAESIYILREVIANAKNPAILYSIGKDSSVLLHLARKAFYPASMSIPLIHVDTTWKFKEMIAFRDAFIQKHQLKLIKYTHHDSGHISPFTHDSQIYTDVMKTTALKQVLDKYQIDMAIGGARRDEEKSRAKERVFSLRNHAHHWDPKSQRPELWQHYYLRKNHSHSFRVFPLSNWTELDIWHYIQLEKIEIVPLYFAKKRPVVQRNQQWIMVDDERFVFKENERPLIKKVRFRTLGCYPLTAAVASHASNVEEIIDELLVATTSERQGRLIDHEQLGAMEIKKQEGYF